jgi:hypothetical protein
MTLRVLVASAGYARSVSRGLKVPRCCRLLLAGRLFAGTLVVAPILLGGNAYGQALGPAIDPDASLLAPNLDGDPKRPSRSRVRRSDDADEGAPLFRRPGPPAMPASGAGLTGFKSNGGLRPGAEPKTGTVSLELIPNIIRPLVQKSLLTIGG